MPPTALSTAASPAGKSFFGHPRGLAPLFMTELWERFSFYGMRAILVLYLSAPESSGGLGVDAATATAIYSVYNALVYMLSMPGGWIADRLLGARRTVLIGGIVITCGHFMLAVPLSGTFYVGLLAICVGTGLLKPNISTMVGGLYAKNDPRKDGGFTLFYMAINIGSVFSPLVVGTLGQQVNWHLGFATAGVGMLLGLLQYLLGARHLGAVGANAPKPAPPDVRRTVARKAGFWVGLAALALVVDVALHTFSMDHVVNVLTVLGLIVPVVYFTKIMRDRELSTDDRNKMKSFLWFFVVAAVFWMIYDQTGSTLSLFAQHSTDRHVFGWSFPASWFQSVNPVLIIILAPVFAWLWQWLRQRNPSTPVKFSGALLLIGASFGVMGLAGLAASDGQLVAPWWLVGVYFLQTCAELCLSPVGLSVSTKLAPPKYASQIMGLWFLAVATGDSVAAWTTQLRGPLGDGVYFATQGLLAVLCGGAFLLVRKRMRNMMSGVN